MCKVCNGTNLIEVTEYWNDNCIRNTTEGCPECSKVDWRNINDGGLKISLSDLANDTGIPLQFVIDYHIDIQKAYNPIGDN